MQQPCHIQKTAFYGTSPHPVDLTFFPVLLFCFLSLLEGEVDVRVRAEHFTVSYSQHADQAKVPVVLLQQKASQKKAGSSVNKHECFEEKLTCLFS